MGRGIAWLTLGAVASVIALAIGSRMAWSRRVHRRADDVQVALDRELDALRASTWRHPVPGAPSEDCNVATRVAAIPGITRWGSSLTAEHRAALVDALRCTRSWNAAAVVRPNVACRLLDTEAGDGDDCTAGALFATQLALALSAGTELTDCMDEALRHLRECAPSATPELRARVRDVLRALAASPPPLAGALALTTRSEASMSIAMMRHLAPSPFGLTRDARGWPLPRVMDLRGREDRARSLVDILALARRCDAGEVPPARCAPPLVASPHDAWPWDGAAEAYRRHRERIAGLLVVADAIAP